MIHRIVQAALRQRFLVLMLTAFIMVAGIISFQRMPVDAYPDLSPPQVELITQWPGHAAEEVERLVTLPLELQMNGVPHMVVMRSISLYGLSDVKLTFEDNTDDYFARQIVFQRIADASLPSGVTPSMAPLFSPSGLVYRYVLESPDRSPQELKVIEDWVVERAYRSVRGVADDSGFGGTTMQYQVLLDPARLYGYHLTIPQVMTALTARIPRTLRLDRPPRHLVGRPQTRAARLRRRVVADHRHVPLLHHHHGSGVCHPHRLHGRQPARRRSPAGRSRGLRRSRSVQTPPPVSRRGARRHRGLSVSRRYPRDLCQTRDRAPRRPPSPRR